MKYAIIAEMEKLRVKLVGGLGNQIFGYMGGYWLARNQNRMLVLDFSEISYNHSEFDITSFNLNAVIENHKGINPFRNLVSRVNSSFNFRSPKIAKSLSFFTEKFSDQGFTSNQNFLTSKKNVDARGYFQDMKYVDFFLKENSKLELIEENSNLNSLKKLINKPNQIAVHIRRGDFLSLKDYHGVLDISWYIKILNQHETSNSEPYDLWLFTNDKNWAEEKFSNLKQQNCRQIFVVTDEILPDPATSFLLFSEAPIKICANSTFSILSSRMGSGVVYVPKSIARSGAQKDLEASLPIDWLKVDPVWEI